MTDEEKKEMLALAEKPKEPDASMVLAMAEDKKGEADLLEQQNKQMSIKLDVAKFGQKSRTDSRKGFVDEASAVSKIRNTDANTAKTLAEIEEMSDESFAKMVAAVNQIAVGRGQ